MQTVAVLFARADLPVVERLKSLFDYNPTTGILTRRVPVSCAKAGAVAGTPTRTGHITVSVDRKLLYVHRIAWAMQTGAWPTKEIDHMDGNPKNNQWINLREADRALNMQNLHRSNTKSGTGMLGAFRAKHGRFTSKIRARGVIHYLGTFATADEAHAAYIEAKRRLHEGCTI